MKQRDYFVRHECGSDRATREDVAAAPRFPIHGVLDNIRSAHNVGSMFRTADGSGIAELLLCGYTPTPPHRHLAKTALDAVEVVPWRHFDTTQEAIADLRARDITVLALEYTMDSASLYDCQLNFPVGLVMGNEVAGLDEEVRKQCDATVHLPMHGLKSFIECERGIWRRGVRGVAPLPVDATVRHFDWRDLTLKLFFEFGYLPLR